MQAPARLLFTSNFESPMKRFLIYCSLFFLPFIISAIPLELKLRKVPNPYKFKYEWMQKNAPNVETLVFGSSHTFYGIRPEYLNGNAFSLANVSQDFRHDHYLLMYWASKYKHLKTIVYPISFFSWFSKGLEHGSEWFRCRYYKIYMDCNLYSDWSIYNLELSDFNTFSAKLNKLEHEDEDPGYDKYGWGNTYKLSTKKYSEWNDGSEAKAAVKRHTAKDWDNIEANYNIIKEMAEFCKSRNIQMVLITTPCWHTYYDNLDQKQLTKMYELTHHLQKEYNLPYFDYLKDSRFMADDFYDSNHLSEVGAEKFTKILNENINEIEKSDDKIKQP